MKKFFLSLLMVLVLLSLATPAMVGQVFPDVKSGHWAERDIAKMKAKGIVAGFADGYHPLEAISREQAIVMILRTMGKAEEASGKKLPAGFKNPEAVSTWAKDSVALAAELGLLSQEDINNFRPKEGTKRYEMAIFVAKALGHDGSGSNLNLGFLDEKDIPAQAKGYIAAVQEAGVMKGLADNTFLPNDPLNRAQMASLLTALDRKLDRLGALTISGKVFSVSAGANSILLEVEGGLIQTISLAKDAFIYKGKGTSLSAITKGDNVQIITDEGGQGLYLEQVSGTEVPGNQGVKGTITLITRTPSVNLRVYRDTGSSGDYVLSSSAVILIDGVKSQAADLTVGQTVTLTLTNNQVTRVEVTTKKPVEEPVKEPEEVETPKNNQQAADIQSYFVGEIVELDNSSRTVRLITEEKIPAYVVLDLRTIIIKRDMPIPFSDLASGDLVIVVGEYDRQEFKATSLVVLDELD